MEIQFEYTDDVAKDPKRHAELDRLLGLCTAPHTFLWKDFSTKDPEIFAQFICDELAELGTT